MGSRRNSETTPLNVRGPRDSIWNVTGTPALISPASASPISASNCMCDRFAIRKRTGDENDAATVCPTSTSRLTTMPSIGARIVVRERLTSATRTPACAARTPALAAVSAAAACLAASCAASNSAWVIKSLDDSWVARCAFVVRSSSSTFRRCASAMAWRWLARASASAVSYVDGSICAMTSPALTVELKSACSAWTVPETWVPVSTASLGSRTPLVSTSRAIAPRVTEATETASAGLSRGLVCSHAQEQYDERS